MTSCSRIRVLVYTSPNTKKLSFLLLLLERDTEKKKNERDREKTETREWKRETEKQVTSRADWPPRDGGALHKTRPSKLRGAHLSEGHLYSKKTRRVPARCMVRTGK